MWQYCYTIQNDWLAHHGIQGQKWGIRRFQNYDGTLTEEGRTRYSKMIQTKDGEKLMLVEPKPSAISKIIGRISPRIKELQERQLDFNIQDKDGKDIGHLFLSEENKNTMNVNWIDINQNQRGKGYATAVMNSAIKMAKDNGYKKITLEVPGDSPDALHIYEKLGFKAIKKLSNDDDIWGGLTAMVLDLNKEHA